MCPYQVNIIRSILILVLIFACSSTFATIFKWVDKEGITHYTQQAPPAGIETETLKPPPSIDGSDAEKNLKKQQEYLDAERVKRQKRANVKQRRAEEKARKAKNCELSRARLKSLTDRPRVLLIQNDGSAIRPTEEQRQEKIAKAKKDIEEMCE